MDARLAGIAVRNDGLVLLSQVPAAGVTAAAVRWAVRSGGLVRLGPGALVDRERWATSGPRARHVLRLRAALARAPGTVAAAESAAVVWDLPLPGPPPDQPVLLRPRSAGRPEHGKRGASTIRRAWLSTDEVTRDARRLPVTTLERTFVDLARVHSLPWSLAVADEVRRRTGCSAEHLYAAVDRHPAARGRARSQRVALLSQGLVESPLESVGRGVQIELGLPTPDVQVWVGDGRPEFRVDMLVREFATVVEADGRVKYEGPSARPGQAWEDKRRLDRLLDLGYDCHRFVAADSHRPVAWGRALLRVFARSCRRQGLPTPDFRYPWA